MIMRQRSDSFVFRPHLSLDLLSAGIIYPAGTERTGRGPTDRPAVLFRPERTATEMGLLRFVCFVSLWPVEG